MEKRIALCFVIIFHPLTGVIITRLDQKSCLAESRRLSKYSNINIKGLISNRSAVSAAHCYVQCVQASGCHAAYYEAIGGRCALAAPDSSTDKTMVLIPQTRMAAITHRHIAGECSEHGMCALPDRNVYQISLDGEDVAIHCETRRFGGGWTVVQRRTHGALYFNRSWSDYVKGFGDLGGDFWFGLNKINRLTKNGVELFIHLQDWEGGSRYARYNYFKLHGEEQNFRFDIRTYSGTAGDSLLPLSGYNFSTYDRDNDPFSTNQAAKYGGGWWFGQLSMSNLNGLYLKGSYDSALRRFSGIYWYSYKGHHYSLKLSEMMIKPLDLK